MKWAKAIAATIVIICLFSIVGNMDLKQQQRTEAWQNSVQAIEAEQEKIKLDILEMREQLDRADEQIHAHNLLIWEIRDRLHLDLDLELKNE